MHGNSLVVKAVLAGTAVVVGAAVVVVGAAKFTEARCGYGKI